MTRKTADVFLSGGGIAGLTAGITLARLGLKVVLADPTPPAREATDDSADLRSTAFLKPARTLLEDAGIWGELAAHATPLEELRVADLAGDPPTIQTERTFTSRDLGEDAFGWNLPNWQTRKVLTEAAGRTPNLDLRLGTGFQRLFTRESEARITLSDGTRVTAALAIAADGRSSPLREAAGIDVHTDRYGQKALAFAVSHDVPHKNISTELYHRGGAFVLVPLPDHQGRPASAVVWMEDGPEALRLSQLDDTGFGAAATARSATVLGPLTPITPRRLWPVVTQRATHLTAERVALIAEAAHVLPPIGAQGLNTSLWDVTALAEIVKSDRFELGSAAFLNAYAKRRETDIRARAKVIDLYNRLCRSDAPPIQSLRRAGLKMVHDTVPLRRAIMRAGMGQ
ncbi:MAG: FAD-dependent monooxygenase [Paracoccaceae bacterium]|nr:FAD-dependent monooxygenase [Paracoccaceae bacterium]